MEIKIDKDVPIPELPSLYPFSSMEVGDSFFAPGKTNKQMQNAASNYRKRGMKFVTRQVTENSVEGTRIWRTE